jgi:hypothetical protein
LVCETSEQVLQNDIDLLNPPPELEKQKHKKKRLVQSPNSFFMVRTRAPDRVGSLGNIYVYAAVPFYWCPGL